jgi:hypothetical protein
LSAAGSRIWQSHDGWGRVRVRVRVRVRESIWQSHDGREDGAELRPYY